VERHNRLAAELSAAMNSFDVSWSAVLHVAEAAAAVSVAWFVLLGLLAYRTKAGFVAAAPAGQELGAETPALAHLLANRWECGEEAAEATFMDMAARGYIAIERVGPEPEQAVCTVKNPWPADLTPYERTVMNRIQQVTVGSSTPLPALAHGSPQAAELWLRSFRAEVIAHARELGLSRSRISTLTRIGLVSLALLPGGVTAVVAAKSFGHPAFALIGLILYGLLASSVGRLRGERDTAAGREAASRWLGMREYLRLHPSFAELPPAAVTMWQRYLAYAAALGVARQVLRVLELGPGDDHKAWSAYGGTWRRVQVRYRLRPSWGWAPSRAFVTGFGWLGWAALMIFMTRQWFFVGWVVTLAVAITSMACGLGATYVGCGLLDWLAPRYLDGLVLRVRERKRFNPFAKRHAPWRSRTYLALDAGSGDTATAWVMAPELRYSPSEGELARVQVGRCFGQVRRYEIMQRSWEWRRPATTEAEKQQSTPPFQLGHDTPSRF